MSTDETHSPCLTTSPEDSASYHTIWIGKIIQNALKMATTAMVRGTTSRGIFLELDNGWIAFLSIEKFRGPLTLNLDRPIQNNEQITTGVGCKIINGSIAFDKTLLVLEFAKAKVWSCSENILKVKKYNKLAMRNFVFQKFVDRLNAELQSPNEYLEFTRLRLSNSPIPPTSPIEENLVQLVKAIQTNNLSLLETPLAFIAGRGRGLTPSGDDFLSGLLLGVFLNKQSSQNDLLPVQKVILEMIQNRSTRISANLAECAASGEIDERIANAVNYLLIGDISEELALKNILDWGSSSGVDMIAGFISAITSINPDPSII